MKEHISFVLSHQVLSYRPPEGTTPGVHVYTHMPVIIKASMFICGVSVD